MTQLDLFTPTTDPAALTVADIDEWIAVIQIDDPPTVTACATCMHPIVWLYSARRSTWVAFVPGAGYTLTPHGCRLLRQPGTWRDVPHGTPPTDEYRAVRQQLKNRTGEQPHLHQETTP